MTDDDVGGNRQPDLAGVMLTAPVCQGRGRPKAIVETIGAVQAQFPGFRFRLAGPVDSHHDQARFTWELGPDSAEAPIVGFVAVIDNQGRLQTILGFLDKVPLPDWYDLRGSRLDVAPNVRSQDGSGDGGDTGSASGARVVGGASSTSRWTSVSGHDISVSSRPDDRSQAQNLSLHWPTACRSRFASSPQTRSWWTGTRDQDIPAVEALSVTQPSPWDQPPLLVSCQLERGDQVLSMFTTLTSFGTAHDVTVDELAIELFYPADESTRRLLRATS